MPLENHGDLDSDPILPSNEHEDQDIEEHQDHATGPDHSLLDNRRVRAHPEAESRDFNMTPIGRLRAYYLGVVVCIGGFLCELAR